MLDDNYISGSQIDLTIYRNAGFQLPIQFQNVSQYLLTLSGYGVAFMIAPVASPISTFAGQFGTPVITVTNPSVSEPGNITFQLTPAQTASLSIGTPYHYVVMAEAPGQQPAVIQFGRVILIDSPPMPAFTPLP